MLIIILLDKAWPVTARPVSKPGNTILVNPNFIPKDKKADRKASKVVSEDEDLEKMNEELKELERQRIELEKQAMKKRIEKLKRDNAEVSFYHGGLFCAQYQYFL